MSILSRIQFYYKHSQRDFYDDLCLYALNKDAVVLFTPYHLLMARPVRLDAPPSQIINPGHTFSKNTCDAWHIHLMIGSPFDLARLLAPLAYQYPNIAFQRSRLYLSNERLHVYSTAKLLSHLNQ